MFSISRTIVRDPCAAPTKEGRWCAIRGFEPEIEEESAIEMEVSDESWCAVEGSNL